MRSLFALIFLGVMIVAVSAFAETNDGAAGMWKGTVDQNGTKSEMILRLREKKGVWKGRCDLDGSASPLTKVKVDGNHVTFDVKGQGMFDGTVADNALTGSLSGTKKGKGGGAVSLARQQASMDEVNAAIDKVVTSSGP